MFLGNTQESKDLDFTVVGNISDYNADQGHATTVDIETFWLYEQLRF